MLEARELTCSKRTEPFLKGFHWLSNPVSCCIYAVLTVQRNQLAAHFNRTEFTIDSGAVLYNGMNFRRQTGYYRDFFILAIKAELTAVSALDNLSFWLAQHNVSVPVNTLFDVLEKVGLVGLEDVPVRYLSAGQQRRVALSRLWLKPAKVWILDEPFTALDVKGVHMLEKSMKEHVGRGGLIITTSHQHLSETAGEHRVFDLEDRF